MSRRRALALVALLIISIALAFAARDLVYGLIVLPLAYVFWQLSILLGGVPEVVRWAVLVVVLVLIMAWQLVPDLRPARGRAAVHGARVHQVESAAVWLHRARTSNYFKWQVAHRLGAVSRHLEKLQGRNAGRGDPEGQIAAYLEAGVNASFVDFPPARRFVSRRSATPLDVAPGEVVTFLESKTYMDRGENAERI
ncbi:MAG TPA: hypothetical protein VIU38_12000 [Anaerolineales bacterium]